MKIFFYYHHKKFRVKKIQRIKKWLDLVFQDEGISDYEIKYYILDDESLRKINVEFLEHDYYTDVITFDYSEGDKLIGEVYISYDTIKNNSIRYGLKLDEEMKRVLVHGILHLIGYNDKTQEEQKIMSLKEEEKLKIYEG